MTTNWGNDDHGPGGDPSWLGGTDRDGAGPQDTGGFSSDFGPRNDQQAAEGMAPQFGERGALPSDRDEGSPWSAAFASSDAGKADDGRLHLGKAFTKFFPLLVMAIMAIFFFRMFSGGFSLWFLLLFLIPFLGNAVSIIRSIFRN